MDDPPKLSCGPHSLHRSVFQVHGVLVSLLRMVIYALIIGALTAHPKAQVSYILAGGMTTYPYEHGRAVGHCTAGSAMPAVKD